MRNKAEMKELSEWENDLMKNLDIVKIKSMGVN